MGGRQFSIRPLRLSEILDEGLELCKQTFFRVLPFQLIVYLPSTILFAYLFMLLGDGITEQIVNQNPEAIVKLAIQAGSLLVIMTLVQILFGTIAAVTIIRGMERCYRGIQTSVGELAAWAVKSSGRAIALGLLLSILFFGAMFLPALVLVAPAAYWAFSSGGSTAPLVMAVLGGLLSISVIIILATYLAVRYGLAGASLAVEDASAIEAMRRSAILVKGAYGRALGLLVVIFAIQFLIGGVLSAFVPTPSFTGVDPDELRQLVPMFVRSQILGTIVGQIAGMFTGIYASACWLLFYFTMRCEKEGFDLEHQLDAQGLVDE